MDKETATQVMNRMYKTMLDQFKVFTPEKRKWYSYYESSSYLKPQYIQFLDQFDTYKEFDEFMDTNLGSDDWYCYKVNSRKITIHQCMEDYFSKAIPRSPQQELKFKG